MNNTLVEGRSLGAVELGGSAKAAPGGYPVGAVGFGPCWEDQPTLRELYDIACAAIVRQEAEVDELRAEVAMQREQARILVEERDEAREALRKLSQLVHRLFALLETVEVSDSEREFHPTVIRSCRVAHTSELAELLPALKEAAK